MVFSKCTKADNFLYVAYLIASNLNLKLYYSQHANENYPDAGNSKVRPALERITKSIHEMFDLVYGVEA